MHAQNFNVAPKYPRMGISSPNFVLWTKIIQQEKTFRQAKINSERGGGSCPPRHLAPCHDASTQSWWCATYEQLLRERSQAATQQ